MSDKIRLIYNKIENRIDEICDDGFVSKENQQEYETLTDLEDFIDSFPKEPVNEDLEEEISNYIKDNFFGSGSMGFLSNRTKGELDSIDVVNIARHFAEWQKQQMKEALQTEYEKGRFDMQQEMMKDAVELHIIESFNPVGTENEKPHGFTALCYNAKYPDFYPVTGQIIKIIPIKTEQQNEM